MIEAMLRANGFNEASVFLNQPHIHNELVDIADRVRRGEQAPGNESSREADEPIGPPNEFLEELHHVGPTGDVFGGGVIAAGLSAKGECGSEVTRAFEGEGMHWL